MNRREVVIPVAAATIIAAMAGWFAGNSSRHAQPSATPQAAHDDAIDDDVLLVQRLLEKDLGNRRFDFATVALACSGRQLLALQPGDPAHQRILGHIEQALAETLEVLNRDDSPVRELRRINEASRFFEDELMVRLDAVDGLSCTPARTVAGNFQRSGYPDLRLLDEASGSVFYLDPKLLQSGSHGSTFRTFYFEPKTDTLKITDDAVHLILGIEHDGNAPQWQFLGWRVVCLSGLSVRLKAEFQASNADLYRDSGLSNPAD
jgi:hypothetical protein